MHGGTRETQPSGNAPETVLARAVGAGRPFLTCFLFEIGCPRSAKDPQGIATSSDLHRFAVMYADGHVTVWDLMAGKEVLRTARLQAGTSPVGVALSADGKRLAELTQCCAGQQVVSKPKRWVHIWSVGAQPGSSVLDGTVPVKDTAVSFEPNGTLVHVAPGPPIGGKPSLVLIEGDEASPDAESVATVSDAYLAPHGILFRSSTGMYDVGMFDGFIQWRPGSAARTTELGCWGANGVLSQDGSEFACSSGPLSSIRVWNADTERLVTHWLPNPPGVSVGPLAFVEGGRGLATVLAAPAAKGIKEMVVVYEVATHRVVVSFALGASHYADPATGVEEDAIWPVADKLVVSEAVRGSDQGTVHAMYVGPSWSR
jgi:hypothetical protein